MEFESHRLPLLSLRAPTQAARLVSLQRQALDTTKQPVQAPSLRQVADLAKLASGEQRTANSAAGKSAKPASQ